MREEALEKSDEAARFLKELRREADGLLNEMRGAREMEESKRIARERIREMSVKIAEALPPREEAAVLRAPVSCRVGRQGPHPAHELYRRGVRPARGG